MKRVFITGANRGIGLELTRQSLTRGDRVFAGCREPDEAAELQSLWVDSPKQLTVFTLDVTDESTIDRAARQVQAKVDGLDLLFNNAGANAPGETITNLAAEKVIRLFRVNAVGSLLVIQRLAGLLRAGNEPKIVNISSEAGSISQMNRFRGYSYYGSKAALNMFTRNLARDKDLEGVVVIALHPGWVRTRMGGSQAPISTAESVNGILEVSNNLTLSDSGKFFTYEGNEYPW